MYNLVEAYNPSAVENVMCTNTLSVSWDGNGCMIAILIRC